MMGRIYFEDERGDFHYVFDWGDFTTKRSYTCLPTEILPYMWKVLEKVYNSPNIKPRPDDIKSVDRLLLTGKSKYGLYGTLYDIDKESNKDIKRKVILLNLLSE